MRASAIKRFFFEPASPAPLVFLRIGIATVLLAQATYVSRYLGDLYGSSALLLQAPIASQGMGLNVPSWIRLGERLGISESISLFLLGGIYLCALVALLAGYKTRLSTIVTWFLHLILMNDQPTAYGTDFFAHVALFLLIWAPAGDALSLDSLSNPNSGKPTQVARLCLRVFQIYLCIAYLASGLEKFMGEQWLNGEAVWRSLMLPSLAQYDMSWIAFYPFLAKLACWGTLLVETGYCLFIWPKQTRKLWVALAISLHLGIAIFLGLWLFSLLMIVLNLGTFGISPQTHHLSLRNWKMPWVRAKRQSGHLLSGVG